MIWIYAKTKWISLTSTKFVKRSDLDCKHCKPSEHPSCALLTLFFWKLCVLNVPYYGRSKRGYQRLTLIEATSLDQQYWESKEGYPWIFGRTESAETDNSAQILFFFAFCFVLFVCFLLFLFCFCLCYFFVCSFFIFFLSINIAFQ